MRVGVEGGEWENKNEVQSEITKRWIYLQEFGVQNYSNRPSKGSTTHQHPSLVQQKNHWKRAKAKGFGQKEKTESNKKGDETKEAQGHQQNDGRLNFPDRETLKQALDPKRGLNRRVNEGHFWGIWRGPVEFLPGYRLVNWRNERSNKKKGAKRSRRSRNARICDQAGQTHDGGGLHWKTSVTKGSKRGDVRRSRSLHRIRAWNQKSNRPVDIRYHGGQSDHAATKDEAH